MTLVDASLLFGAVDRRSSRILQSQRALLHAARPLFTTEACLAEAMHLAGSRIGWRAQDDVWRIVRRTRVTRVYADIELTETLMRKYRDVPMDFADATLVALCSEDPRLRVATFDSDFLAYRRDDGTPIPLADDRRLS